MYSLKTQNKYIYFVPEIVSFLHARLLFKSDFCSLKMTFLVVVNVHIYPYTYIYLFISVSFISRVSLAYV